MKAILSLVTVYCLLVPILGTSSSRKPPQRPSASTKCTTISPTPTYDSCGDVTTYITDSSHRYRWGNLPAIPGSPFTFKVKAGSDVHIALSSRDQDTNPMYEIVIGGWYDQWSAIRRRKQGTNLVEVKTSDLLSTLYYRGFWVSWSSRGTISVGKFGESCSFMQWTDPNPISIRYVGYTTGHGYSGSWKFCEYQDVNECSSNNGGCMHNCRNTVGSYRCSCRAGYELWYFRYCLDIDECSGNNGGCSHNCVNTDGSYRCNCRAGYQLYSSRYCRELDECASNPCRHGGTCRDLTNSYRCDCRPGWTGVNCHIDYNECSSNNGGCQHNCVNTYGSYRCTCRDGYQLSGSRYCTDLNECDSNPCRNGGTCRDLTNSYRCDCRPGWTGVNCQTDYNECSSNNRGCQHNCVNTVGSYRCTCREGYQMIGSRYCIDLDECDSNPCRNGGTCRDLTNSYRCDCRPGWTGVNCQTDINECNDNDGQGPCDPNNGICHNSPGSYRCWCTTGFELLNDLHSCEDVNGCLENAGRGPCDHICTDLIGDVRCSCRDGYQMGTDGYSCDVVCPRGNYKAVDDTCVTCGYQEYQDEEGQSSCKSCPVGTNVAIRGATSIAECAAQCFGGEAPCADCRLISGNVHCECSDGWAGSSDGLVCGRDDDLDNFSDAPISCGNGICTIDNCPGSHNPDQLDMDGDGKGDVCDEDIDGDEILNNQDNCPLNPNSDQTNSNDTPAGNACETSLEEKIAEICENQPDGTYRPHPHDCSKYVRCHHAGSDAVFNCPPSTHWSQELLTCVRSDLVTC